MRKAITGLVSAAALAIAGGAQAEVLQYHPNSPVFMGGNFDPSFPGRAYPECLQRTTVRPESLLPGQRPGTAAATQFFLKKVTSRKEMYRLLNVSLSISGSYGFFSGDFSGSLEQENTFSEDSFTWIIQGFSNYGKYLLERTELTTTAKALSSNPVGFRNLCGTDYAAQEVRAAQATAVFTIKNLSESERKILEAKFSASYGAGPLDIGGSASYRDFVKTAAAYGQIEVKVYALGGPGVSALAPIMSNVDKPDKVIKTIEDYFKDLTLEQSVAIAYNTGSLQSLIGRTSIESDVFNRYIADTFEIWESLGAEQTRLQKIANAPGDWGLTVAQRNGVVSEIQTVAKLRKAALDAALSCKAAFTDFDRNAFARRTECRDADEPFMTYSAKYRDLTPRPYYLRYFVTNELIPNEEVVNFSIKGPTLKNVKIVKKLAAAASTFQDLNSVQIATAGDGSRSAGTSIIMKDIPDVDLPIGVRVELDSGSVYFEQFAFTRAPVTVSAPAGPALFSSKPRLPASSPLLANPDRASFSANAQVAPVDAAPLPAEWVEAGNKSRKMR